MRLLLLLCLLCMAVWRVDGNCGTVRPNGCSNYGVFTEFEHIFTRACNWHDICYGCARHSRQSCDEHFHRNLLAACRWHYRGYRFHSTRNMCETHANAYRLGVNTFGWLHYNSNKPWFCRGLLSILPGCH
ncbi:hypothetical protein V1264_014677 [Littorina saxatilis]|uniref:Conodipine-M alpha chain n=1 Tax=Littorina saxatilis TaxID=31220 RepID=A0AAN9BQT8_9CAEN